MQASLFCSVALFHGGGPDGRQVGGCTGGEVVEVGSPQSAK